jgi:hypothetical protein
LVEVDLRGLVHKPKKTKGADGDGQNGGKKPSSEGDDPKPEAQGKPLAELLKDDPELLAEVRKAFKEMPEWQGIDPDSTPVFYRPKAEVDAIRARPGESGGHHPHGLVLVLPHPVFDGLTIRFCDGGRPDEADLARVA